MLDKLATKQTLNPRTRNSLRDGVVKDVCERLHPREPRLCLVETLVAILLECDVVGDAGPLLEHGQGLWHRLADAVFLVKAEKVEKGSREAAIATELAQYLRWLCWSCAIRAHKLRTKTRPRAACIRRRTWARL